MEPGERLYWENVNKEMVRKNEEMIKEWKKKDEEFERMKKIFEINEHTPEEINIALQQIRIDKLKHLINSVGYKR